MTGLIRADLIRWRARPEIAGLLLMAPVLAAITFASGYAKVSADLATDQAPSEIKAATEALLLADYRLPRSVLAALVSGPWLILAAFLAGDLLIGLEFTWGTIRLAVLTSQSRAHFLAVRFGVVFALAATMVTAVGLVAAGASLAVDLTTPVSSDPTLDLFQVLGDVALIGLGVLVYAAIGAALALWLRNPVAPLVIGIAMYVTSLSLSGLPLWSEPVFVWIPRLLPVNAAGALFVMAQRSAGMIPDTVQFSPSLSTPWPINVFIGLAWVLGLATASVMLFRRSDIRE